MKTSLLIAAVLLFLLPSFANGKVEHKVVLYLPFDEGKGKMTKDKSGFRNDAEIFKAEWVDGKFGKALRFSGPGHYARTTPHEIFAFKAGDEITVMSWIKLAQPEIGAIIYNRPEENKCNYGFRNENRHISWFYRDKSNATWHGIQTQDPAIPIDEWVHVAATNTFGNPDAMKVYLNGKQLPTKWAWDIAKADPIVLKGPIDIGARWAGQDHLFNGIIDEAQIWKGTFSEKELQEIMQAPASEFLGIQPYSKLATTWGAQKQIP